MNFYVDNLWEREELYLAITLNIGQVPIFGIGISKQGIGIALFGFGINLEW
jgi:hypothetical protein